MKKIMSFVLLSLMASSAFATETLKGYVNYNTRNQLYFVSVDTRTWSLTGAMPMYFFSEDVQEYMMDCMDKKMTHVILIDQVPDVQENVPTSIPGRTTTTHFPKYENVRCAPAEGFIETWRDIVSKSKFR